MSRTGSAGAIFGKIMKKGNNRLIFLSLLLLLLLCFLSAVALGSVSLSLNDVLQAILRFLKGEVAQESLADTILFHLRIPRALTVLLLGAGLALSGASMQGLLQNPLAEGSTLGVASGASLGAVLALAFELKIPLLSIKGITPVAIVFAILSLVCVLSLSYSFDKNLSNNTIILIGVIFSMFAASLISLTIVFSAHKLQNITFWTMGSVSGASYDDALTMFLCLLLFGIPLLLSAPALNAFSISESNALHIGVNVKRTKMLVMLCVCAIIGTFVSLAGPIGFVGLVIPHMLRMVFSSNHKTLLPQSMLLGASFLLVCDIVSRILLPPIELPLGVITSLIGTVFFMVLFIQRRRRARHA